MKTLWQAISIVAVIHVVVLAALLAWLWMSGRIEPDRLRAVQAVLTAPDLEGIWPPAPRPPTTDTEARGQVATSSSSVEALVEQADLERREQRTRRRLEEEKQIMLAELVAESERVEAERRRFEERRQAWEERLAADLDRRRDEQFRKTVRLLDGLPPKQAKQHLAALVLSGDAGTAAAYLDAMQVRQAQKTLAEFKSAAELELASELLALVREP